MPRAVLLAVVCVLLAWAVLLWGMQRLGMPGVAGAFLIACGLGGGLLGHRVRVAKRVGFGLIAAPTTAVCVWGVALFGAPFEGAGIALAALGALLGLSSAGFGVGIFGLFWLQRRQRALTAPRH